MSTSDRRLVFVDIDGTYAHHGTVPAAHEEAVVTARAAGHRVLLCTGRSAGMLPRGILDIGFDGIVASAGCYVEVGGTVLVDRRMPDDLAARVLAALDDSGAAYVLEAPDGVYARPGVPDRLRALLTAPDGPDGTVDFLDMVTVCDDLSQTSFAKATYLESAWTAAAVLDAVGPGLGHVPTSLAHADDHSGEIHLLDVHKAVGIRAVVEHFGAHDDTIVAFGDGINDVEMLQLADIGVAIEGSHQRVLDAADLVAAPPLEAGLAAVFAELGLR
jgi:Cof subfamily protein (haloacid dehalogenase superfamily)